MMVHEFGAVVDANIFIPFTRGGGAQGKLHTTTDEFPQTNNIQDLSLLFTPISL
jgi:hypothetical protein